MYNLTELERELLQDCAKRFHASFDDVVEDFAAFNREVNRLIIEENLTEDEALNRIEWDYDRLKKNK